MFATSEAYPLLVVVSGAAGGGGGKFYPLLRSWGPISLSTFHCQNAMKINNLQALEAQFRVSKGPI